MTDQVNCFLIYLFQNHVILKLKRKLTGCLTRDLSTGNNQEAVLCQAWAGSCEQNSAGPVLRVCRLKTVFFLFFFFFFTIEEIQTHIKMTQLRTNRSPGNLRVLNPETTSVVVMAPHRSLIDLIVKLIQVLLIMCIPEPHPIRQQSESLGGRSGNSYFKTSTLKQVS